MCSLEDAWGTTTFMGSEVESQADDRVDCMRTPDNLLYPKVNISPLTKPLPYKNKMTRGIHSMMSRQQRVPNNQHRLRGNNGTINVNPIMNNPGGSNTPLLNQINENFHEPMPMANDGFTDVQDAFHVSSTVDRFMNMGLDMSDDYAPVDYQNVNNNQSDLSTPDSFTHHTGARCQCLGVCKCNQRARGNAQQHKLQQKMNEDFNTTTEDLKKKNEEIIKKCITE